MKSIDVPVLDAVLNCLTIEQADARCNEKSQLPLSLSATAIHMAALRKNMLPLCTPVKVDPNVPVYPTKSSMMAPLAETHVVLAPQPCGN